MRLIEEEYLRHLCYGTRKMRDYLSRQGYPVCRKRVRRLMRKMGLASVAPKPNTSLRGKQHKLYPYLLRGLRIDRHPPYRVPAVDHGRTGIAICAEREVFGVIWLDKRHGVLEYEELFFGAIDGAGVYPGEVVERALHHNAAA
jgi:hypothetical protein